MTLRTLLIAITITHELIFSTSSVKQCVVATASSPTRLFSNKLRLPQQLHHDHGLHYPSADETSNSIVELTGGNQEEVANDAAQPTSYLNYIAIRNGGNDDVPSTTTRKRGLKHQDSSPFFQTFDGKWQHSKNSGEKTSRGLKQQGEGGDCLGYDCQPKLVQARSLDKTNPYNHHPHRQSLQQLTTTARQQKLKHQYELLLPSLFDQRFVVEKIKGNVPVALLFKR